MPMAIVQLDAEEGGAWTEVGGDQLSGTSLKLKCHQAKAPFSVLKYSTP